MIAALWSRSKHLSARLNKKGDERRDRRRGREIKGAVERERRDVCEVGSGKENMHCGYGERKYG